jgi:hypothetical protein
VHHFRENADIPAKKKPTYSSHEATGPARVRFDAKARNLSACPATESCVPHEDMIPHGTRRFLPHSFAMRSSSTERMSRIRPMNVRRSAKHRVVFLTSTRMAQNER